MQRPPRQKRVPDGACSACKVVDGMNLLACNGGCGLLIHRQCIPTVVILDAQPAVGDAAAVMTPPGSGKRSARLASPNCRSAKRKTRAEEECGAVVTGMADSDWRCERCECLIGRRVLARDDGDLFWHVAKVLARDPHGQVIVQWEDRTGADATSPAVPFTKATVSERYVVLLGVPAKPSELRHGRQAVALWTDGLGYLCELLGNSSRGRVSLQFEDGLQYDAPAEDVMIPLEEPLFPSLGKIKASAPLRACDALSPHSPSHPFLHPGHRVLPACPQRADAAFDVSFRKVMDPGTAQGASPLPTPCATGVVG